MGAIDEGGAADEARLPDADPSDEAPLPDAGPSDTGPSDTGPSTGTPTPDAGSAASAPPFRFSPGTPTTSLRPPPPAPDPPSAEDLRRARRSLWWSRGLWVLGLALIVAPWTDDFAVRDIQPLLLGPLYVNGSHLALLIQAFALLAWIAVLVLAINRNPDADRRRLRWLRSTVVVIVCLAGLAVMAVFGFLYFLGLPAFAHVLLPASPDGCRLVAVEDSGWDEGGGDILLVEPGAIATRPTQTTWSVNQNNVDPVTEGSWSLSWQGRTASLSMTGTAEAPVTLRQNAPITCPEPR